MYYGKGNTNREIRTPRARTRWNSPPLGQYKTNFDGVMFEETNKAGIGVVIRNSAGEVMASLSKKISFPSSVEAIEVLATRWAANFVQEISIADSIFEGDS